MKTTLALFICVLYTVTAFAQPDTLWTRTYGGGWNDQGYSVQQTNDGGYIIVGETTSYGLGSWDVYLFKTDALGDSLWSKTFGGSSSDRGCCVQQTSDGGYIVAGYTTSYGAGDLDVYLIKTDALGTEQWNQTFGDSSYDRGNSVQQTSDGGYIIAGNTESYGAGNGDVYLIKTEASGTVQWSQTFGGSDYDAGFSVQQTSDGGYIIAGFTESYGAGDNDVYLIKADSSGTEQWSQTFGGSYWDWGASIQQTSEGGYIIAGMTESYGAGGRDVYLIMTDASGNEQWNQTFGGTDQDEGYSVQQTSDGGYIITGSTHSYGAGYGDVWLIRLDVDPPGVIELDLPQPLTYSLLPAYPNPFNPSTLIRFQMPVAGDVQIQVYDIQGNVVATLTDGWQTPGSYQVPFNASNLSSGIYLARLTTGDYTQTRKMVLMK